MPSPVSGSRTCTCNTDAPARHASTPERDDLVGRDRDVRRLLLADARAGQAGGDDELLHGDLLPAAVYSAGPARGGAPHGAPPLTTSRLSARHSVVEHRRGLAEGRAGLLRRHRHEAVDGVALGPSGSPGSRPGVMASSPARPVRLAYSSCTSVSSRDEALAPQQVRVVGDVLDDRGRRPRGRRTAPSPSWSRPRGTWRSRPSFPTLS